MSTLLQDLRYGWRSLWQTPGLTLAAVLSLGLGIGANTTVFSWIQSVLLRPIPGAADPDRIFTLGLQSREGRDRSWSYPNYRDLRGAVTTFDVVAQDDLAVSVAFDGQSERAYGAIVSGNYFQFMGVAPALGRLLTPDDDRDPGAHPVIVLSHAYWQRRFAGDPAIVGREMTVNGSPFTVVGVGPPRFIGSFLGVATAMWAPMAMQAQLMGASRFEQRGNSWFGTFVRPHAGVTRAQLQAEAEAIVSRLAREYPTENDGIRLRVLNLWEAPFGAPSALAPILMVLAAVVVLVLALACANVTNLLLARAIGRQRDVAIRLSLGASRGRLLRQLLTESVLLAVLAGAAGLAMAYWTSGLLMAFAPPTDMPIELGLGIDRTTFLFASIVSIATGIVFGVIPALQASRPDTVDTLKEEAGRGGSGASASRRLRSGLVVAQIAVCVVLLISAGLFVRSLNAAQLLDPGFETAHQLIATIDLGANGYTADAGRQLHQGVLDRVGALPGVQSVALSRLVPLSLGGRNSMRVSVDGYVPAPNEELVVNYNQVSTRYFETMRVPFVGGRDFAVQDVRGAEPVAIINETMAQRYWQGRDAVGGLIRIGKEGHRVVGVVRDIKQRTLNEQPAPFMFLHLPQYYAATATIQARTEGDPGASIAAVRQAVRELDANLPVFDARTMTEHAQTAVFPQRIGASMLGVMGLIALLLATIGLYGVMAYVVGQRRTEMGIRLALGATPGDLQRMVVGQGATMTAVGVALGLAAAFGAAQLVKSMLPGITPSDPLTFVVVPIALILVALVAAWLPARRAAATDPVIALRM